MEHEASIEKKLDEHIEESNKEYRRLLGGILSTVLGLIVGTASLFISIGHDQERLEQLEKDQQEYVTKTELQGAIALFNNKIDNLTEKIDRLLLRP